MTDYFALLDEPRRPCLDAESLKKKFHALSARIHPDKVHSAGAKDKDAADENFANLNAAYNYLREPKERLRHLLELELGSKPKDLHEIPSCLADLFIEIGALCRQVDSFLSEKAKASSPLLRAQLFERGQAWADKLTAMQRNINEHLTTLDARLRSLDARWMADTTARVSLLSQLEEIWRLLVFFTRWSGQIQERLAQIAY